MRTATIVLAVLAAACASTHEDHAPPQRVRDLVAPAEGALGPVAFLTGTWVREEGALWHEETWSTARGGRMVGYAHVVRDGRSAFTESLQIRAIGGRIVYVATPEDELTTVFPLAEARAGYARFEAPEHDFPRTIEYELVAPDEVEIVLTGAGDASHGHDHGPRVLRWRMRRAAGGGGS
jgi:hypothetical protein